MAIKQRDVYNIELEDIPNHPCIVISSDSANQVEGSFIAVLITSSTRNDQMTFPLFNQMFDRPLPKNNCQVRCHMISLNRDKHIVGNKHVPLNRMKVSAFRELMKQIANSVFDCEYTPNF